MGKVIQISVDAGNGGVNAVTGKADCYFPSVRSVATGDRLDISLMQMDTVWHRWGGAGWYIGDDVARMGVSSPERHQGANRYGNEFHQHLVAHACAKLGAGLKGKTEIGLTLFAPPGLYNEVSAVIQRNFMENDGAVEIHYSNEDKPRKWNYTSVTVWPEGIGAAAALMFDHNGQPKWSELFRGQFALLDGGIHTLDSIVLSDGDFNPETLQHATWANDGLRKHILDPILRDIRKRGGDFSGVTLDHIDAALRDPEHKVRITSTVVIPIGPALKSYGERYAGWVANTIIDPVLNGLNGYSGLALVGGWTDIVEPHLRKWYGDKIFDRTQHTFASKIHPAYWNSYGGAVLALLMARAAG